MQQEQFRVEHDSMGDMQVPADALWGAQTQRSYQNFRIGTETMPVEIVRAFAILKKAAAQANVELGVLPCRAGELISQACDEILAGKLDGEFPLKVWQTGSGTQSNMNVNEVVANRGNQIASERVLHPNDSVNRSQSSNDTFPTALHIACVLAVRDAVLPAVKSLAATLERVAAEHEGVVKCGRTHLQDATPLTFGQEVSGYISALKHDLAYIQELKPSLYELAIGGTAVGTGLNAAPGMTEAIAGKLSKVYGHEFKVETNKFWGLAHHSALSVMHGALKTLANDMFKIAQDIRFLASGPRAGYGELNIPANEPGSSIMPGKVNPTQAEAVTMAVARVLGNDVTINFAASQGNFEMNVFKTVMIAAFLESADILTGTITGFADKMIHGLTVNEQRMDDLLENSLMTVTALSPKIGYHEAAVIAQTAQKEGMTLKEAALKSGKVTEEQYDEWMDYMAMTNVDRTKPEE